MESKCALEGVIKVYDMFDCTYYAAKTAYNVSQIEQGFADKHKKIIRMIRLDAINGASIVMENTYLVSYCIFEPENVRDDLIQNVLDKNDHVAIIDEFRSQLSRNQSD